MSGLLGGVVIRELCTRKTGPEFRPPGQPVVREFVSDLSESFRGCGNKVLYLRVQIGNYYLTTTWHLQDSGRRDCVLAMQDVVCGCTFTKHGHGTNLA